MNIITHLSAALSSKAASGGESAGIVAGIAHAVVFIAEMGLKAGATLMFKTAVNSEAAKDTCYWASLLVEDYNHYNITSGMVAGVVLAGIGTVFLWAAGLMLD